MPDQIRPVNLNDVTALCEIYNHYVEHSIATFEEVKVSEEEFAHRISVVTRHYPWLIHEMDGKVTGFAYANLWKGRSAYRHSLESTIYLDHQSLGLGIGKTLYQALLDQLVSEQKYHRVMAGISLPNDSSVALHESLGFTRTAIFPEVGRKFGRWIDVGYWVLEVPGEYT